MFERFTENARQVMVHAQDEARQMNHDYIGTEHLLLGLHGAGGVAARILENRDLTVGRVRAQVVRIVGCGEGAEVTGQIPFTPRAKRTCELALREALVLGHAHVGTGHLLLGLLRDDEGVAARILQDLETDVEELRRLTRLQGLHKAEQVTATAPAAPKERLSCPSAELIEILQHAFDVAIAELQVLKDRRP